LNTPTQIPVRPSAALIEEKKRLRAKIRAKRTALSEEEIFSLSKAACDRVLALPEYRESEDFWCYVSLPGEVQTDALIERALRDGKRVAVPRVLFLSDEQVKHPDRLDPRRYTGLFGADDAFDSWMEFFRITSLEELHIGHFLVREPSRRIPASAEKPLIIMPGVAFDRKGNRLGYGKGYYDRFLRTQPDFYSAALSFSFALLDEIPHESIDTPIDRILTEKETLTLNPDLAPLP